MFTLFFSLYMAMLTGTWTEYSLSAIATSLKMPLNNLGKFLTSIFGDVSYNALGSESLFFADNTYYIIISLILATITSIGIVVMAVKGIKRVFGVFFMGIRR